MISNNISNFMAGYNGGKAWKTCDRKSTGRALNCEQYKLLPMIITTDQGPEERSIAISERTLAWSGQIIKACE